MGFLINNASVTKDNPALQKHFKGKKEKKETIHVELFITQQLIRSVFAATVPWSVAGGIAGLLPGAAVD